MLSKLNELEPRKGLVEVARDFHANGWMSGTAGNMSVRLDVGTFWLTASGKPKGRLDIDDFVKMSTDGDLIDRVIEGNKPSAESSIHEVIYRLFPEAGACLHVHSVDAYIATSRYAKDGKLLLPNIEMIKGFDIWEEEPNVSLDVFDNHINVSKIAEDIADCFNKDKPSLSALMIKDHGITVWAEDLQTAYNRTEILEFIMTYLTRI